MKKQWICRMLPALMTSALLSLIALPSDALGDSASVVQGEIRKAVFGAGEIQPARQPGAYVEITGEVEEIYVSVGDTVRAGDIVARIENDELDAEVWRLERDLQLVQKDVLFTKDHEQYVYRPIRDKDGDIRLDVNTGEVLLGQYSNEISIRSPGSGRIMAVYIEAGDDALAQYREHGCVAMISTDGRMKVEMEGVEGIELAYDQTVRVLGDGIDEEGKVVSLTKYGTCVTVQILNDKLPMDAPVTVETLEGEHIGEGTLAINKPLAVSAYGGTVKGVYSYIKPGRMIERDDVIARIDWSETPLYIDNDAVLREYTRMLTELEKAWEKVEALVVTAPCDGVVASIEVEKGDDVEDGMKLLSVVDSHAGMELVLRIDELDIVHVQPGQKVEFSVDAMPDAVFEGEVLKIAPLGNTETSVTTYDVYIRQTGEIDERIRGGMNITGEIIIESAQDALLIPTDALIKDGDGWQVQMKSGEYADVEIGVMTGETTQIVSGLYEGETVIY